MKIAILGTRGIPNNYGGFEQCAEYLSVGLVKKGHSVSVYSPVFHPYDKSEYKGVKIIKKKSPQKIFGTSAANFIYDYLCLRDAVDKDFDINDWIADQKTLDTGTTHLFLNDIHEYYYGYCYSSSFLKVCWCYYVLQKKKQKEQ